jgi:Outer membrane protein beta-barrel domain
MKKVFVLAIFTVIIIAAQAQVKLGVQAGINAASFKDKFTSGNTTTTTKYKAKVGFTVGVFADISISDALVFRPGLNFIQKGGKSTETRTLFGITTKYESTRTSNYLELPLIVVYKIAVGGGNIFVGAGPSIGYGLSGKDKAKATTGNTTQEQSASIKFDGKDNNTVNDNKSHLKALDFGGNFMAGYQLGNNISAKLSYSIGFSNINPDNNSSTKNKGFGFTVGYVFGGSDTKK